MLIDIKAYDFIPTDRFKRGIGLFEYYSKTARYYRIFALGLFIMEPTWNRNYTL